jgi:hypothetical protein
MFRIEMFPASYGDCLWIEYGSDAEKPHRILIDCGVVNTFKLLKKRILDLPQEKRTFDLFVISHIDNDHIEAAVTFLKKAKLLDVKFEDVWFNDWEHISDLLGPLEAEYSSALIDKQNIPLNEAFKHRAVVVPEVGDLPCITFASGMCITLLSPGRPQLDALRRKWKKALRDKGMIPGDHKSALKALSQDKRYDANDMLGPSKIDINELAEASFVEDKSVPNGSSIAFLAEFEGKCCLFAADAFPSVLIGSIKRLLKKSGQEKLPVNAIKIPHHGSRHNTSKDFLEQFCCSKYLFSTNGKKFEHPDAESIARVVQYRRPDTSLYFNYRSKFNSIWDNEELKSECHYQTFYPSSRSLGYVLDI